MTLIDRLKERAHDPQRAIDEGGGYRNREGRPVVFLTAPPATQEQAAEARLRLWHPVVVPNPPATR